MGLMGGSVDETFGGSGGDISYDAITAYLQAAKGDAGWGYGIQSIVIHYLNSYVQMSKKQSGCLNWLVVRGLLHLQ